eukprot:11207742-Lingulodinium_polyedra.AAC.1
MSCRGGSEAGERGAGQFQVHGGVRKFEEQPRRGEGQVQDGRARRDYVEDDSYPVPGGGRQQAVGGGVADLWPGQL